MKVLWFTNTPSLYDQGKHQYYGGGWIESLEESIASQDDVELAISFFYNVETAKIRKNNVTYYPIFKKPTKKIAFKQLLNNWQGNLDDSQFINDFLNVINDFKPDIINVFGTEGPFGLIKKYTKIPVVVHIQGLINPYVNAFFPVDFSKWSFIFSKHYFLRNLIGTSPFFNFKKFRKQASREVNVLKNIEFVFGRTEWDKNVTKLINPDVKYFHIDEVLRPIFYLNNSQSIKNNNQDSAKRLIILSTISSTTYKGIDVILKTAFLLKNYSSLHFEWRVIGVENDNCLVNFLESKLKITGSNVGIQFLGILNHQKLIDEMYDANVFVHPSYIDNSPNSVCEAQIVGLPVIACNVGGVSTMIQNLQTGILVPSNGVFEIANELINLNHNPTKMQSLGELGRERALHRHNKNNIIKDLLSAYHQILSTKN